LIGLFDVMLSAHARRELQEIKAFYVPDGRVDAGVCLLLHSTQVKFIVVSVGVGFDVKGAVPIRVKGVEKHVAIPGPKVCMLVRWMNCAHTT
jgi:hypothetical protein